MEADKDKLEEFRKRSEEVKKLEEQTRRNLEEQAKMLENAKRAIEESAKAAAKIEPARRDWQEFRFTDPEWEKFKILLQHIGRLEKQGKSAWKRQLLTGIITGLVVLIIGGIYTIILLPRVEKWIAEQTLKPNKDRCAIVFLKDDPYSKEIAFITTDVLEPVETGPLKKFRLVVKDSTWYAKYYTGDALVNKSIELSYNHPSNAWLVDGTPDPASVYHNLKKAIFVKDSTGRGIRDTLLPLSKPGLLWKVEDVRTREEMEEEAGLERFAVIVVSPPCSWYKNELP